MIMHDDPNPISRGRGLRLVPSLLVVLLVASVFVVSYSTDQGLSWAPNILMNQSHPSNLQCQNSDPWMALAPDQRVQYAYLEFNCNDGTNGLDVSNTTNGQDWGTVHYKLGGGGLTDKDSI